MTKEMREETSSRSVTELETQEEDDEEDTKEP